MHSAMACTKDAVRNRGTAPNGLHGSQQRRTSVQMRCHEMDLRDRTVHRSHVGLRTGLLRTARPVGP